MGAKVFDAAEVVVPMPDRVTDTQEVWVTARPRSVPVVTTVGELLWLADTEELCVAFAETVVLAQCVGDTETLTEKEGVALLQTVGVSEPDTESVAEFDSVGDSDVDTETVAEFVIVSELEPLGEGEVLLL